MGRIRTVKPEFFASESMGALSLQAERSFIGLWTQCDDWGRTRDNAKVLNGALWPMRVEHTWQCMEDDLLELVEAGKVCRYEVDGRRYLHIPTWRRHQVTKSSKPLHPGCPVHNPPRRGEATQGAFDLSEDAEAVQEPEAPVEAAEGRGRARRVAAAPSAGERSGAARSAVHEALVPWWEVNQPRCLQTFTQVRKAVEAAVRRGMTIQDAMRALDLVVDAEKPIAVGTLQYALSKQGGTVKAKDRVEQQAAARDPRSFSHEL